MAQQEKYLPCNASDLSSIDTGKSYMCYVMSVIPGLLWGYGKWRQEN